MDMLAQPDLFKLKNTPRLSGESNDFVDRWGLCNRLNSRSAY